MIYIFSQQLSCINVAADVINRKLAQFLSQAKIGKKINPTSYCVKELCDKQVGY